MSRSAHFGALALMLLVPFGAASALASPDTLSVYTWSDYLDPELVSEFETEHGARVEFSYFISDEARDKELTARGGSGFDVIMVNRLQMPSYARRGWTAPLDRSRIPNLEHLESRWTDASEDAAAEHGVAYFWGTLGIAWRADLYPEGLRSWRALLEPDERLSGHLMMPDDGRELVGLALKADGHSVNTADRTLIRAAGERLARQKPHVKEYGYSSLTEASSFITGEVWAGPMYSGDALVLKELDEHIEYRIPDEGGILWVDYLAVAGTSTRKALAHAFIDFLNRPEVAARNAEYVHFATPNRAARELASEDYLADPVIHPDEKQLDALESFDSLPARSTKSMNAVISELHTD